MLIIPEALSSDWILSFFRSSSDLNKSFRSLRAGTTRRQVTIYSQFSDHRNCR